MEELELSVMMLDFDPVDDLRPLLDQFEAQHKCHVRVSALPWATGWADLVKIALHGVGPDVSEIGTTWCSSFVAMGALRPFAPHEVTSFGGASAFLPSSWQTGILPGDNRMWAVPWLADLRIIYYRRDLLEQAASTSKRRSPRTAALRTWAFAGQWCGGAVGHADHAYRPAQPGHVGLGGRWRFHHADGKRSSSTSETRWHAPTELGQYLSPAIRNLDMFQSRDLFWQGQAAVLLGSSQRRLRNLQQLADPQVAAQLSVALVPGVTWMGGTNLVVWQHVSRFSRAREILVIDLVRFLTSHSFQSAYGQRTEFLPVRHDVLDAPPFGTDPIYRTMAQGLRTGRTFPSVGAWGLVEDKIMSTLERIWKDVLTHSSQDLDAIIAKHIEPLPTA
jgi:multiple sugar transport system substrate-binding protein